MKSKVIKRAAAALTAMVMAVSMMAGSVSAANYEVATGETSGGIVGTSQTRYKCYVYKNHYASQNGVPERTLYGVTGSLTADAGLKTNWTGKLTLMTSTTEDVYTGSAVDKNSCTVQYTSLNGSGLQYKLFQADMNSRSLAFGISTYHRNGAF